MNILLFVIGFLCFASSIVLLFWEFMKSEETEKARREDSQPIPEKPKRNESLIQQIEREVEEQFRHDELLKEIHRPDKYVKPAVPEIEPVPEKPKVSIKRKVKQTVPKEQAKPVKVKPVAEEETIAKTVKGKQKRRKDVKIPKELLDCDRFVSKDVQNLLKVSFPTSSRYIKHWIGQKLIQRVGSPKSTKCFYQKKQPDKGTARSGIENRHMPQEINDNDKDFVVDVADN